MAKFLQVILGVAMVDENNIVSHSAKVWAILGRRSIRQIGIREMPDECRYLGSHSVLLAERLVRIALDDEAFKERAVQVISFTLLDSEAIVVNLRTELPVIALVESIQR